MPAKELNHDLSSHPSHRRRAPVAVEYPVMPNGVTRPDGRLVTGERFSRVAVELDGHEYRDCVFDACQLVYGATAGVRLTGCTFDSCDWVLTGAAELSVRYLNVLREALGEAGDEAVAHLVGLPVERSGIADERGSPPTGTAGRDRAAEFAAFMERLLDEADRLRASRAASAPNAAEEARRADEAADIVPLGGDDDGSDLLDGSNLFYDKELDELRAEIELKRAKAEAASGVDDRWTGKVRRLEEETVQVRDLAGPVTGDPELSPHSTGATTGDAEMSVGADEPASAEADALEPREPWR